MSNNANNFNIIITNLKNGVYIKASATVEAALVMPLYIYAVMAVTYMMQIYQIRLEVDAALYNALREQNKYNYLNYVQKEKQNDEIINEKDININDTIVGSLSLHSVLIKNLGSEYAKEHNIKGGNSGIKIICYSYDSSTIQAAAEYSVKNPFDIFGIGYIKVVQEFTYEVWLGEKYAGDYGKDKDNTDSVFITRTGTVYHKTRNCPALYIDVKMVDFSQINNYRNKNGSIYYPCSKCKKYNNKNESSYEYVYVTDYGVRYHRNENCSEINRTIIEISRNKVTGMRACRLCAAGEIKEKKKLMENILLCINMMVLSVQDIMYKSLNVIILVILTITAVIYTAFNFNFSLPEIIAGICFVGALFGVSITFKCIGIGDVIVTLIVILIKGTVFAVFSFTMATLLLGIVNFIRLVKKEISVKSEIPFVPYLGICAMVTALCM